MSCIIPSIRVVIPRWAEAWLGPGAISSHRAQGAGSLPPPRRRASSWGPDSPESLLLRGLLIQGSAGLRWGPCGSVLTQLRGCHPLSARRQLCGFRGPRPALPAEQQRPVCGRRGGSGRLRVGCVTSAFRGEATVKRRALNQSHGPCVALPVTPVLSGTERRALQVGTLSLATAASCCPAGVWPRRAVLAVPGGRTHATCQRPRCPRVSGRLPEAPLAPEQVSPRACRPQGVLQTALPRLRACEFPRGACLREEEWVHGAMQTRFWL